MLARSKKGYKGNETMKNKDGYAWRKYARLKIRLYSGAAQISVIRLTISDNTPPLAINSRISLASL